MNDLTLLRLALEGDCRKSVASSLSVLWAPVMYGLAACLKSVQPGEQGLELPEPRIQ